jgi:TDG/mug DNA glycosylase family protein
VIAPGLRLLFIGINPGLISAATGHHFARPGNRFWKVLHLAGFTERVLSPVEDRTLLDRGLGITNVCNRTTARAEELTDDELRAGGRSLRRKIARMRPQAVAFVGIGAYRVAMRCPTALLGEQPQRIAGARVFVVPNTSGLNAHYPLAELVRLFAAVREQLEDKR